MLILVVVLLLFGAKRLPEVGSSIGKGIREFKRSISDTQDAIMGSDERTQPAAPPARTPPAQNQPGLGRAEAALAVTPIRIVQRARTKVRGRMIRVVPAFLASGWLGVYGPAAVAGCGRCSTFFRLSTTLAASAAPRGSSAPGPAGPASIMLGAVTGRAPSRTAPNRPWCARAPG